MGRSRSGPEGPAQGPGRSGAPGWGGGAQAGLPKGQRGQGGPEGGQRGVRGVRQGGGEKGKRLFRALPCLAWPEAPWSLDTLR